MDNILEKYKNYSIDDLRSVLRGVDREKYPDLFEKAKIELENKIRDRKDVGDLKFRKGTDYFMDSYVDEKLTRLSFNDDSIIINNNTHGAYVYFIGYIFITLLLVIAIIATGDKYYLFAFIPLLWIHVIRRMYDEIYQYSRETIVNIAERKVCLRINRTNESFFKFLFNLRKGEFEFENIESFCRMETRNLIYAPTNWIFYIKIILKDKSTANICFISSLEFADNFVTYLNRLLNNNDA